MEDKLKQGEALFAEGKIEEAEKCFSEILNEDPKNKEAYNNLGVIAFQQQNIEQAIQHLTRSLEIDPFYKDAALNYCNVLRSLNLTHKALPFLEKVIQKYPGDQELSQLLHEARWALQQKPTSRRTAVQNSEPDSWHGAIIGASSTEAVDLAAKLSAPTLNDGQYIGPPETVTRTQSMRGSWLWEHKKNIRSQNGEDGIIEKIFEVIGAKSRWCVEFGAWDGEYLSNAWNLINNKHWSAVLIEGDELKANELARKYTENPNVFCIQTWVSDESPLDKILAQTPIPLEFDLLSVDIDGDDYWAWRACEQYRPRVVIIETNPTFGHDITFVPKKKNYIGASMRAMVELGKAKDYELAVYTSVNCIFVTKKDFHLLHVENNSCENLFHGPYVPRLVSDYEGNHFLIRGGPWGFKKLLNKEALRNFVLVEPSKNSSVSSMTNENKSSLIGAPTEGPGTVRSDTENQGNRASFAGKEGGKVGGQNDKHILLSHIKASNHALLPEFLQDMRQIFDADVFVETGTLLGYTADAARKIFRDVYTIELGQDLYQAAAQRFAQIDNCHTYQGDSAGVLKKILPGIEGKMLFWLDAHFSEGITAKGETNTPILAELQAIKESGKKDAIILIDDIRCFQTIESGTPDDSALQGYPLLQQVRDEVYAIDNAYQFVTLGDIALAYPSDSAVSVSPLVQACTVSRLFDDSNVAIDAVLDAEKAIAMSQGQEREAIQMLAKSVLATGGDSVGGHYRLWYGLILAIQNRYTEACNEFQQAIDRGCNHWRVLWHFAHAAHKGGRNDAAVKALRTLSALPEFEEARVLLEQPDTVQRWFRDNGDNTLRLDYPLSEDSVVFDVGGYVGKWSQKIAERYNPYIYIFEPVPQFYSLIVEKFKRNPKVSVSNFGLLDTTRTESISVDNDSSSIYTARGNKIEVSLVNIEEFLVDHGIRDIDLIKINIEGAEYPLLKRMINKGIVQKCRDIQVQFHTFYPNALKLWNEIRDSLRRTHSLSYDYPFVWENWRRKNSAKESVAKLPEVSGETIKRVQPTQSRSIDPEPGNPMQTGLQGFYEENLVCPATLEKIKISGNMIATASGKTYCYENDIPCFLSSTTLTAQQKSELESATRYICEILNDHKPLFSPDKPFAQPENCWGWVQRWVNPRTVKPSTKIVCIGGAFADDLPHVYSEYKFNIDHLAHEYRRLLPQIEEANTHYVACEAETLPFRDGYADIVYARNCLDHVCNPLQTLQQINRILSPNGKLFVGVYYNSTFINEHESTVIDDEFIESCIEPLFDIEHRFVEETPRQEIFGNGHTGFVCLVCQKRPNGRLAFTQEQILCVGKMLSNFHSALYEELRGDVQHAIEHYRELLRVEPVLTTDLWRQLYALIRLSALTNVRYFTALYKTLRCLSAGDFWLNIADNTAQKYHLPLNDETASLSDIHQLTHLLELSGVIPGWRALWLVGQAAYTSGSTSAGEQVAQIVSRYAPDFSPAQQIQTTKKIPPIVGVIFSKDRAMQLHATLSSLALHCKDIDSVTLKVLYRTSSQLHEEQYQRLIGDYKFVEFIRERNFKQDLMALLRTRQYILFLVDDNIFVGDFCLSELVTHLDDNPDAVGFSLRLGENTTYCYTLNKAQSLPEFKELRQNILKYDWTIAEYDFGYPLEVSSSIYRSGEMIEFLQNSIFSNPNTLESQMAANRDKFKSTPFLLTYRTSVAFSNPINMVQSVCDNRIEGIFNYTPELLAQYFNQNHVIDVEKYKGLVPNAAHHGVELIFRRNGINNENGINIICNDNHCNDNPKLDVDANIEKGEAAFNKGDFKEAEKYFLEALKIDSKKKEAYNNLGVITFQRQNIQESVDYFIKALKIDPFYKDAIINYSVLLKSLDRFHESVLILEKAMGKFPHDKEITQLLDEARLAQGSKRKIAVLCLPGLQSFLGDIVDYLKTKYDVRACYSNNNQEIESAVRWADVVWLEWANELTVALTNHPTMLEGKHVICRLHSYEAFSGYAGKINWGRIADLIFVAKHIKDIVLQQVQNIPNRVKNIHIVPNGVNLDKFIFRDRSKGKNLAYLGQINYKKGPMLLLHAFRELVQADKKYRLFIGGNFQDARYELYFSQMIKEMGLGKNIQMDGWIEEVGAWLEDKHYVVCSSVLEGHPVGLMEAMACGLKPIIHNFVGAKGIYPTKYLWNVIPEFVRMVTHKNYDSSEYRRFIETNYSLDIQLRMIDNILSKPKKVKQIPVTGNMIADTAEKPYNDVTAVIAVRNGSTTIKKTLDSLLSQTVPLKKIIVVDDCSNDETPKVVEDYVAKSNGKIELLKLPYNHWVYKARNAAFEKIETEFFFFLDADDFVDPSYTERLLTVLRENPDCAFAYSDMIHFNESQQVQTSLPDFDVTTLMERNYIPYSALMRYSDFRSLGGYSNYLNDCRNHMTEWDLWLRFVAAGKAGKHYPEPFFYYYQAADQMSKNYERTRSDMQLQMALNRGASVTLNCGNDSKTLLVCQGRDYLDRSKVGFEVYTWLKPLAKFGEVFTFFYDVESQYFGQDGMTKRLLSLIDQIQPTYIFHPAYKEHISIDCWKEISKRFVTMVWFSDDNWRFASYSKRYCHGFRFALTTYPEVYEQYKAIDYRTILLSQWAANTEYFQDHGLPKDIDVSFCGQKYGDRSELLEGSGVQCFGKGWPNGLLDFPEMAKVLNRSKISINFSKGADGKLQMKLRPFEIAASNTLLLCEKTDELNKYYKIGKEVIVFENKEDLRQKIDYYLQHDKERKQIARAAYERTIKEHTWDNRFEEIIKAVNGELM